jgi:hypothetical protein
MKDFLVNLSRKRRIMVPVVTLLALSIGISGYYIENERLLKEQAEEATQTSQEQISDDDLSKVDKAEPSSNPDDPDTFATDDDSVNTTNVDYVVNVTADKDNDKVIVRAQIEATEPGICFINLKQGSFGPEQQIETIGGSCEATFDSPGDGTWQASVKYQSNDKQLGGSGSVIVEL